MATQAPARGWSTGRRIAVATAVAGTLDILAASFLTLIQGRAVDGMPRTVASGPFPGATGWGVAGAALGLAVHFAIMAAMAGVFVLAADRLAWLKRQPALAAVAFGIGTYVVMNLIVVPLRWPAAWPPTPVAIATQLFCHVMLVALPIALIARR